LGNTPGANATFVGLSVLREMVRWTWSGGPSEGPFKIYTDEHTSSSGAFRLECGTSDGTNGYAYNQTSTDVQWVWNAYLSEIGVFDRALSANEMDAIFAARDVW